MASPSSAPQTTLRRSSSVSRNLAGLSALEFLRLFAASNGLPPPRPVIMCIYTVFHFLCGGTKLKIAESCPEASTNYLGIPFCPKDQHAHLLDGKDRQYATQTYGPGICSNTHCRANWGMIASTEHDKCKPEDLIEDDSEFDMSPEACQEREDIWFRKCLDVDQQMEAFQTIFPIPREQMSFHAKFWLFGDDIPAVEWLAMHEEAKSANPDEMNWRELNPKYMSQKTLQHVTALYLPACVTDTRQHKAGHRITTPAWPQFGPFRCKSHKCLPAVGFCKTCGIFHGKEFAKNPAYYDASFDWATRAALSQTTSCGAADAGAENEDGHTKQMLLMPIESLGPLDFSDIMAASNSDDFSTTLEDSFFVDGMIPDLQNIPGFEFIPGPQDHDPDLFANFGAPIPEGHDPNLFANFGVPNSQTFNPDLLTNFGAPGPNPPLTINTSFPIQPLRAGDLSAMPSATTGSFWSPAQTPLTAMTDFGEDPFTDGVPDQSAANQGDGAGVTRKDGEVVMRFPGRGGGGGVGSVGEGGAGDDEDEVEDEVEDEMMID